MNVDEAIATEYGGQITVYEVRTPDGSLISPADVLTKVFFGKHPLDEFIKAHYWCVTGRITDPCTKQRPCWTNYQCRIAGCFKGSIKSPVEARLHVLESHGSVTGWSIAPHAIHISEKIAAQAKLMREMEERYEAERQTLHSEMFELRKRCVHKYPDGSTAVKPRGEARYFRNPFKCLVCERPFQSDPNE